MKISKLALAITLAGSLLSGAAFAAEDQVDIDIDFDTPLTVTTTQDIAFGTVKALQSGTYTIDTTGSVTPSSGGETIGGTTSAASVTIAGSTTQTIDITASGYTANNNVTPSAATCSYDSGSEVACNTLSNQEAPGAGTTLLVGVQVAADGSQTAGSSAAPYFDIVVTYN